MINWEMPGVMNGRNGLLDSSFIIHHFLVVAAVLDQTALLASRVLRTADPAAMTNQIDVHFVVAACGNHRGHQAMRFFIRATLRDQRQPPRDAKDVRVYWKDRAVAGEQQGAGDRLGADALEARQEGDGFFEQDAVQEVEIERAAPLIDFIEQMLDTNGFLFRQPAGANRGFNRSDTRPPRRLPGWKFLLETGKGAMAVGVSR